MQRCRKLVGLLGCAGAGSVEAYQPVATQGLIGSSSHAPSSSRLVGEEEEEEDDDDDEEEATYEEGEEEDESNGRRSTMKIMDLYQLKHLKHLSCRRRGIRRKRIC